MTTIYVDSSALLKRVKLEPQSAAVAEALRAHAVAHDLLVSSTLAWVEVWRALRRASLQVPGLQVSSLSADATAGVAELPLTENVLLRARSVGSEVLGTLDAIHLASALAAGSDVVMTFDDRLAAAARAEHLDVVSPG